MTSQRDPDAILAAWLEEGPTGLPEPIRRAIAVAIPTTAQRRHGWMRSLGPVHVTPIGRNTLAVLGLIVAICGTLYLLRSTAQVGVPAVSPSAGVPASPEIVIPPDTVSRLTAEEVAQKMLTEIAANERKLGYVLAPARIIRIQLLREDEKYQIRHLDGTNPEGRWTSPDGGPGWIVEAVGTFVAFDDSNGQLIFKGIHGFHRWDDAGGEGSFASPCWLPGATPTVGTGIGIARMEGFCP